LQTCHQLPYYSATKASIALSELKHTTTALVIKLNS